MPKREPLHPVQKYINDVLRRRIVVGALVRMAVERHMRDLAEGHKRGLRFDEAAAQHAIDFFQFLRHSKGEWAGQTLTLSPWQQFIVWCIFGWRDAQGRRRFRNAYIEVARKNGKSTMLAGIGLYLFFADGESGAEVYTAATKRDQARIVHEEAVRMVRASPPLKSRIGIFKDNLHIIETASKFEPLGADEDSMDGLNVHGAIIDELHAHRTRGVFDKLDTATSSRRQPLICAITTAGDSRHSVCWEQHDYAAKIMKQDIVDDSQFCFVAGLDEGDDWRDEKCWSKANPNIGVSVKLEDLRRKRDKAIEQPTAQKAFRQLHCNEWMEQEQVWEIVEKWDAPAMIEPFRLDDLVGRPCCGGLDLASRQDITAHALVFEPIEQDPCWYVALWCWIPLDTMLEKEKRDRVPYSQWRDAGLVKATPGNMVDFTIVSQDLKAIVEKFRPRQIAYDPWNAAQLAQEMTGFGVEMVQVPQTINHFTGPTKMFEALVVDAKLRHGGNPLLRWMLTCTSLYFDKNQNVRPVKPERSTGKRIDGVVATIMGLGRAMMPAENTGSVYETPDRGEGLLVL